MQHRGVKARRVKVDGLAPGPLGVRCRDEVVVDVEVACVHGVHDAIDQVEEVVGLAIGETGRPHALRARQLAQVCLLLRGERVGIELPARHVAGVIDGHTGHPFEGRDRDVEVIALAADAGVGVESRQYRVSDHQGAPSSSCSRCLPFCYFVRGDSMASHLSMRLGIRVFSMHGYAYVAPLLRIFGFWNDSITLFVTFKSARDAGKETAWEPAWTACAGGFVTG